jgi:dipeptidyl aminopeptidase/acylaminoacyl peptidase
LTISPAEVGELRRVALFVSAALVLSACSAEKEAAPPPEPPARLQATDVSSLRVSGQQDLGSAYYAWLSPDGKTVLYQSPDGTCLRAVDGSGQHCLPAGDLYDTETADWSPDGTKIAMTESLARGHEPDLWVLDVASGELTRLTEDRVDMVIQEIPDRAVVDITPSWSEDGKEIRFLRRESANSVSVMSVSPAGGDPARLGTIETPWEDLRTVAWSDDSVAWLSWSFVDGEVFVAGLSGESRKVLDGEYSTLSFSADGNFLLADQPSPDYSAGVGKAVVVPARGGDPIPVADGKVMYPTWAPDGHALAYVEAPGTLRVVGKPGGTPRDLHQQPDIRAADLDNIDWVPGRMLVSLGTTHLVALTIDGT